MGSKVYEPGDIGQALRDIGVEPGDTVFLHSNLGFFGAPKGVRTADEMCEVFLKALKEVLGETGTLVVPVFSYSFCHGEVFDPKTTKSTCGMFPEYVRKQAGVLRSLDPNFSIAAWGRLAEFYVENPAHESFGEGCFWERFLAQDGKIVCMNTDAGVTFLHYVERCNRVAYRYNKAFNGTYIDYGGQEHKDYFVHFVYDMDRPEDESFCEPLDALCRQRKVCRSVDLGKGSVMAMGARAFFDLVSEELKRSPRFLTCGGYQPA